MPKTQLQVQPFCTLFLILLSFLQIQVGICSGISVLEVNSVKAGELAAMVKRVCVGKVGDCSEVAVEEEMMDSESNRRVLFMQKRYISYDTLRRDLVPCDRPGASYYNCKGPGVANTYNRGCEIITRCARGD
ncbi:protein RALF-like 24 [Sesamum indicum]|uniref:Protein RALF-like 24 n=1 Tax=Sesamum indicum TaxID=4182 RepID=A0A6I9SJ25_SESIN|nr:protein RALF-like 24 [Sesamum indicum]